MEQVFQSQRLSGEVPTIMLNRHEGTRHEVDTLAITMVAVYLAQMVRNWQVSWSDNIQRALDFIQSRAYHSEIEDTLAFHFNAYYPPDWEDTSFAIFLLARNGRLDTGRLAKLRDLLHLNTTEDGTGIWLKDPYSSGNAQSNHWDPTSSINILRLHYLLETEPQSRRATERFVIRHLRLDAFSSATLYYTAPTAAFFASRLLTDFPELSAEIHDALTSFVVDVRKAVGRNDLIATPFEKALLGYPDPADNDGLIFHHGKRTVIWYGSPILHQLACMASYTAPLSAA